MGWLITLVVGGIIGWLAGAILGKDVPFGIIGNIIAGLIGASIGNALNLDIGPEIGGMSIVGGLLGAIILILIVSFVMKAISGNKRA
ncbi:GlsB/YeaQ/YmgE family stress response membrane protein [Aliicoccus persicus]|uniref:GlsB/YeaQ/YmgE family stress response membrane protein n=1 Tax=Aliicoccus persicus TaxID=930138 RepID=A0A921B679_9STAP|nr:GlsB/YeaQ/YmgE family stress response membrane protein [Aliicoccus persicus]HJE19485.1 GlsB/YeaQ/YmgE family stress response membrane protein [Aliicoccus persicus]